MPVKAIKNIDFLIAPVCVARMLASMKIVNSFFTMLKIDA